MTHARTFAIPALLALAALAPRPARAQAAASLTPMPRAQFLDSSGRPLAGGCVWTYAAGSTTPLNSYNNAAGTANPNPVVLDSAGRADIWLGAGSAYKITVSAKTSAGCVAASTPLYTADNVIDQGFALARSLQTGSLTLGLRGLPITGTGGGVGVGNAVLSATLDGLYVSVNGAAPVLLSGGGGTGGGAAAGPVTSLQYNNGGSFGGSANLKWDNGGRILVICGAPSTGCTPNSGVEAPTFSAFGAAGENAFETNVTGGPGGESHVTMDGNAFFQGVAVTNTFNSLATGPTLAITQASKTFNITGAGDAGFQTMGLGLKAAPVTGFGGGVGKGEGLLSVTPAGLYLSLDGAPPALITGGGGSGTPGAPTTSVQFNNAGTFAGSANMKWNSGTPGQILIICGAPATGCDANSGVEAPTFSSFGLSGDSGFETNVRDATGTVTGVGTSHINNSGDAYFQGVNVTATFNSLATGLTNAVQQVTGTFHITGAGDFLGQTLALGLHASPVTGHGGYPSDPNGNALLSATSAGMYISLNGAAPVLVGGGGGSGTPGAPTTSIQFNNAGTFAGSGNLIFDNANAIVTLGKVNANSSFNAPIFVGNVIASAGLPTFENSDQSFMIDASGNSRFQTVRATTVFNSLATGTTAAFTTAGAPGAVINGQGDATFSTVGISGGLYGLNSAGQLTVSSCIGCVGSAAGANTQIQFNNGGVFAASANFTWNNSTNVLNITGTSGTSGVIARTFTGNATGTGLAFQTATNSWQVNAAGTSSQTGSINIVGGASGSSLGMGGNIGTYRAVSYFSGISSRWVTGADNSLESGGNSGSAFFLSRFNDSGAFMDSPIIMNRSDGVLRLADGWAVGSYSLNAAGALNVASCTGCGAGGGVSSLISSGNGLAFSASTGAVTGSLAQDIRTSANVNFQTITSFDFISCNGTGVNPCMKSGSGTWSINGNGTFLGQSIATGANNGTIATAGQGATISNSGSNIGMVVYDTGGHCNIGTGAFSCASDERLKRNIAPIGDALRAVNALRPVSFVWRGGGTPGLGFIAQDVQKVLPGLVTTDKGGYLELSEVNMIPYLVRSIQQLQAEVDQLRSRSGVAALYDQLNK